VTELDRDVFRIFITKCISHYQVHRQTSNQFALSRDENGDIATSSKKIFNVHLFVFLKTLMAII